MFGKFALRDNNMGIYIQMHILHNNISAMYSCVTIVHSTLTPGSSCPNLLAVSCIDDNEFL